MIIWIFSITGFQLFNLPLKKYNGYKITTNSIPSSKYNCHSRNVGVVNKYNIPPLFANNKYPSEEKYVSQEINLDDDDEDNDNDSYDDDDFDADGMPLLKDPRHSATRNE